MTEFEIGKMIGEFEARIKALEKENEDLKKRLALMMGERMNLIQQAHL